MAPYVKRFFQIDGNSPKKSPSKSPQSSPEKSPDIVPFGRLGSNLRTANDDFERKKYERATRRRIQPPQQSTTEATGESSSNTSSVRTPSRSVKKSPGKVSKRQSTPSPRALQIPDRNKDDDEELIRWTSNSKYPSLKRTPPASTSTFRTPLSATTPRSSRSNTQSTFRELFPSNENSTGTAHGTYHMPVMRSPPEKSSRTTTPKSPPTTSSYILGRMTRTPPKISYEAPITHTSPQRHVRSTQKPRSSSKKSRDNY